MARRRPFSVTLSMPSLVGWLFADLFVVLFVVSLASAPPLPQLPRPVPTPKPVTCPSRVLSQKPVTLLVPVSPADFQVTGTGKQAAVKAFLTSLNSRLAENHLDKLHAGFVLIFASGPSTAIGQALTTAGFVLTTLRKRDIVFTNASGEGLWRGPGNDFKLQIFFYA